MLVISQLQVLAFEELWYCIVEIWIQGRNDLPFGTMSSLRPELKVFPSTPDD